MNAQWIEQSILGFVVLLAVHVLYNTGDLAAVLVFLVLPQSEWVIFLSAESEKQVTHNKPAAIWAQSQKTEKYFHHQFDKQAGGSCWVIWVHQCTEKTSPLTGGSLSMWYDKDWHYNVIWITWNYPKENQLIKLCIWHCVAKSKENETI